MCSPSPPPAPDYRGAAEETAEANLEAQRRATIANRPAEYTPFGSREWTRTPVFDEEGYNQALAEYEAKKASQPQPYFDEESGETVYPTGIGEAPEKSKYTTDEWRSDITLSPELQRLFDIQQQAKTGAGELGLQGLEQIKGIFESPFQIEGQAPDYEGPGGFGENRQRVMDAMMSRTEQDLAEEREGLNAKLIAQGIPPGSEAWERAQRQIDRQLVDARQQAEIASTDMAAREYASSLAGAGQKFQTGLEGQRQRIQEALLARQTPLSEYNAFMTGSQPQMPQFGSAGSQAPTAGPDYMGALQGQSQYDIAGHNVDVANTNQRNALATLAMMYFSDRRLKKDLKQISTHKLGIPIYEFSYLWDDIKHVGVMAQDLLKVLPEAVHKHPNGYYMVNYGLL